MSLSTFHVRPGPAGVAWLASRMRAAQAADPLTPVTVVAPSQYAALHLRRALAATSFLNVRFIVLGRLAEMVGAAGLAGAGRSPLTGATRAALVRAAVRRAAPSLSTAVEHLSLVDRLAALALELRRRAGDASPPPTESATGAAALAACRAYEDLLVEHGLYDEVDLYHGAAASVSGGAAAAVLHDTGRLVVYLPARLGAPELILLEALGGRTAVEVGLTSLGDRVADSPATRQATALRGLAGGDPIAPTGELAPPDLAITIAVDAVEEVRICVRRILAALEESPPVPLHRTAILYRDHDTYATLARDTMLAAGIPHAALEGQPLSESIVGRGLLGLLRLREADFGRAEVLAWLSGMPHGRAHELSPVLWDRLSRRAGVVRGAAQWQTRMRRLAASERERADRIQGDGDEAAPRWMRHQAEQAESIADHIAAIDADTKPPAEHPTWAGLVAWAQQLRRRFLPTDAGWPEDEHEAAQLVDQVLEGLAGAGRIEADARFETFVAALDAALTSRSRPEGRLGIGVVIGSLDGAMGMSFDRVHVLGMTERSFPTTPAPDPFFGGEDPLQRRFERLAEERRAYLCALAATGGDQVGLSFPQTDAGGRPVYPSPWVVEAAGGILGSPITPTALRAAPPEHPRIHRLLGTPERALVLAPAALSLSERRTKAVMRWITQGGAIAASPLARRPEAQLGRALEALHARWSARLTAFDGNLATAAAGSPRLAAGLAGRGVSASVIQGWAECPFSHLMSRILHVEATERPEDEDDLVISPLERGSLVHAVFEHFYGRLRREGRPRPAERFTAADHELIELVAAEQFDAYQERGVTGNRLIWENVRAAILRDLHTALRDDDDWRHREAVAPMHFERRFGFEEDSWPAPVLSLGDERQVRLRGVIDRVDINLEGTVAQVIDYKTGRCETDKPAAENLLLGGRRVQLAVYAEAVRRRAEEAGEPVPDVKSVYWFVSAKGEFKRTELVQSEPERGALKQVVNIIDEGVRRGAFPQAPGEFNDYFARWDNCKYCQFDRICPSGRDAVWERKNADSASRLHSRLTVGGEEPA